MKYRSLLGITGLLLGAFVLGRITASRGVEPPVQAYDSAAPVQTLGQAQSVSGHEALEQSAPRSREPASAQPDLPIAAVSEEAHSSVCEAFATLSKALHDYPLYNGDDSSFSEKYHGATAEQLQAALVIVRARTEKERKRIVEERIREGLYEEVVHASDAKPIEVKASSGGGPLSFGFVTEHQGGFARTKQTTIPADEYPDFRNLELEWVWLIRQVRGQGLSDCGR